MTSSIPDGLSTADLQAMLASAATPEDTNEPPTKLLTHEEIGKIIIPAVMSVREDIGDISAYKSTAMYCLHKLFEFHNEVAIDQMDEEKEAALCWARDAGWLQVCLNTLRNVGCGPNDHFADQADDDED